MTDAPTSVPTATCQSSRGQGWSGPAIFGLMAIGALSIAQGVFVPIFSATVLALTFSPVRRAMGKFGVAPGFAAGIIIIGLLTLGAVILYYLSAELQAYLGDAPKFADKARRELSALFGTIEPVLEAGDQIDKITAPDPSEPQTVQIREPGFIKALTHATPAAMSQLVVALTLGFFLIASGDMFYEKLVQVMPTLKDKRKALAAARKIEEQLSSYLFTITVINAVLGVVIGLTMWLLGMPNPLIFGLAAFLLNYIPYIGSIAGITVTLLVGLVTFDGTLQGILPAFLYWVINSLEGQFLTPVLVGRRLKLNAVVIFISFALWAWVWGFMGMLLSTPILLMVKVICDNVDGLENVGKFLAARDDLSGRDSRVVRHVLQRRAKPETPVTPANPAH